MSFISITNHDHHSFLFIANQMNCGMNRGMEALDPINTSDGEERIISEDQSNIIFPYP